MRRMENESDVETTGGVSNAGVGMNDGSRDTAGAMTGITAKADINTCLPCVVVLASITEP